MYWTCIGITIGICSLMRAIYVRSKDLLALDIHNTVSACRTLGSWDDRSEMKLSTWLAAEEDELHRASWIRLYLAHRAALRYYAVHAEMDDGEPYGTYQAPTVLLEKVLKFWASLRERRGGTPSF